MNNEMPRETLERLGLVASCAYQIRRVRKNEPFMTAKIKNVSPINGYALRQIGRVDFFYLTPAEKYEADLAWRAIHQTPLGLLPHFSDRANGPKSAQA